MADRKIRKHIAVAAAFLFALIGIQMLYLAKLSVWDGDGLAAHPLNTRTALTEKGYQLAVDSPTNQIFLALDDAQHAHLSAEVSMGFWEKQGDVTIMRIATSWATQDADVERLIAVL
mgnify:CR=1 FL=1